VQGKATIAGHPIHPMLIPFPIAFFAGALISDIVSAYSANPVWPTMSVALIGFGIVAALLAALFGFVDYFSAAMSEGAKKTATTHMVLYLLTVVIFVAAFFLRYAMPPSTAVHALTVIGVIVRSLSGALGGHLA